MMAFLVLLVVVGLGFFFRGGLKKQGTEGRLCVAAGAIWFLGAGIAIQSDALSGVILFSALAVMLVLAAVLVDVDRIRQSSQPPNRWSRRAQVKVAVALVGVLLLSLVLWSSTFLLLAIAITIMALGLAFKDRVGRFVQRWQ